MAGLLVVPHAGETRGPHVVRAAIELLGAARIAHGVRAAEDPDLLRLLAERRVVCDVCLTSNVRLGAVPSLPAHPLSTLIAHGVPVTVNADDPLLLATTLTNEYVHVRQTWHLDDHALALLALAGLHATGMTETTKTRIQVAVRQWLADGSESPIRS
jgi:adenosine deaminase